MLGGSPTGTMPERFTACRPFELTSGLYHTFLLLSSGFFRLSPPLPSFEGFGQLPPLPLDSLKYSTRFCGCQSPFFKFLSSRPPTLLPLIMYKAGMCKGVGGCWPGSSKLLLLQQNVAFCGCAPAVWNVIYLSHYWRSESIRKVIVVAVVYTGCCGCVGGVGYEW